MDNKGHVYTLDDFVHFIPVLRKYLVGQIASDNPIIYNTFNRLQGSMNRFNVYQITDYPDAFFIYKYRKDALKQARKLYNNIIGQPIDPNTPIPGTVPIPAGIDKMETSTAGAVDGQPEQPVEPTTKPVEDAAGAAESTPFAPNRTMVLRVRVQQAAYERYLAEAEQRGVNLSEYIRYKMDRE
jgi:hypothetical protein